jgi:CBS domain-containing protein
MKDLSSLKVADVMSRGVVTVDVNASFSEVIKTLNEFKVHAVIVIGPGGEFMGVISHSDIVEALGKYGAKIFDLSAEDIMCPKPYTIDGNATLKEAATKMINNRVHRLLVLSPHPGKLVPVGVLSATDIVRVVAV